MSDIIVNLVNVHSRYHQHRAALDLLLKYAEHEYTQISYHASNLNLFDLSTKYAKLAYENINDGVSAYNLGLKFLDTTDDYEKYMKEAADKGDPGGRYRYGLLQLKKGNKKKGMKYIDAVYNELRENYQSDSENFSRWDARHLRDIASKFYRNEQLREEMEELLDKKREERITGKSVFDFRHLLFKERFDQK